MARKLKENRKKIWFILQRYNLKYKDITTSKNATGDAKSVKC